MREYGGLVGACGGSRKCSAHEAPRVPVLKLSRKRTMDRSSGAVVPPEVSTARRWAEERAERRKVRKATASKEGGRRDGPKSALDRVGDDADIEEAEA